MGFIEDKVCSDARNEKRAWISGAKDEFCSPEKYKSLGKKMLAEAEEKDDKELKIKAERVLEIVRVYEFYRNYLDSQKMLDFGDLI